MAKDNIQMPQSMAGLQRFSGSDSSKFKIKPTFVIFLLIIVIALVLFLHLQGNEIFGIASLALPLVQ
ncbi:MAG TPA: preprotein translocase subunit Sec61beta [Acidobacteriota bacterium]|nr:preprotein translocase subunit Sec61beta [Acidobacteriota bacterium]